jgi:hypothetical protein
MSCPGLYDGAISVPNVLSCDVIHAILGALCGAIPFQWMRISMIRFFIVHGGITVCGDNFRVVSNLRRRCPVASAIGGKSVYFGTRAPADARPRPPHRGGCVVDLIVFFGMFQWSRAIWPPLVYGNQKAFDRDGCRRCRGPFFDRRIIFFRLACLEIHCNTQRPVRFTCGECV